MDTPLQRLVRHVEHDRRRGRTFYVVPDAGSKHGVQRFGDAFEDPRLAHTVARVSSYLGLTKAHEDF